MRLLRRPSHLLPLLLLPLHPVRPERVRTRRDRPCLLRAVRCVDALLLLLHRPCAYAQQMRQLYGLQGDDSSDVLATLTGCMSIAQEAREIKARGPPPRQRMQMPTAKPVVAMQVIRPSASPRAAPPAYTEQVAPQPQPQQQAVEKKAAGEVGHVWVTEGASGTCATAGETEGDTAETEHEWVTEGASGTCATKRISR